jgi:3-isopropylmalate/(R)-2-methylmalate dehydratase large subunit
MAGRTSSEKVLSAHAGRRARAGDIVVCSPDLILGTDGSTPMAIDCFEAMGGRTVPCPDRILLARDHYSPPTTPSTLGFHARMKRFALEHALELLPVGGGISFQVAMETGRVAAGDLVVGADSHTVTCGAAGAFATGIGSADLAGAFLTGQVWLRVPETTRVILDGHLPAGVVAKDLALELVRIMGSDGAAWQTLEFTGPLADTLPFDDRSVLSNMSAEMGAKAGIFPSGDSASDADASFVREIVLDASRLEPRVALPHDPANGVPIDEAIGTAIDFVFLGTCTGGHAGDLREALRVLEAGGGIAEGVTVVVTPPTPGVRALLEADGTLAAFLSLGAIVTETGCGPCCGTAGPIPPPGASVLSTANRNFRARMGQPTASIRLASPATCAAAATAGWIIDPRRIAPARGAQDTPFALGIASLERAGTTIPQRIEVESRSPCVALSAAQPGLTARQSPGVERVTTDLRELPPDLGTIRRFQGRARRLGDNVNTDYIISSSRKKETIDPIVLKQWLLESVDPDFAASIRPGDILVAGAAFGCGSAMEVAVTVVLAAGIHAVIAKSFSRMYFRNAINNGLIPIECDTTPIAEGDDLEIGIGEQSVTVDVIRRQREPAHGEDRREITDAARYFRLEARAYPRFILEILRTGGLVPYLRGHGRFPATPS